MLTSKSFSQFLKPNFIKKSIQTLLVSRHNSRISNGQQHGSEYTPVYSFPQIKLLAVIHKIKVYQTAATCIGIPASFAMSVADICSTELCMGFVALGVSGCIILHTLGYLTSNTVGIVYLHKDETKSKISYLDGWGSRRDLEIPLKDIVPFSDQPASITDPLFLKLKQYSCKDNFKMNVKYGVVLDSKKFEIIFHKS